MAIVIIVLTAALVFVIAAVAIGREAHRLDDQAPRPVFDMDEAVEWIGERLPFEVSASLSHADVSQIVRWSLDHLAISGQDEVLVVEDEALAYVQVRARGGGHAWTEREIQSVLDVQLDYLRAIGAAGPPEE